MRKKGEDFEVSLGSWRRELIAQIHSALSLQTSNRSNKMISHVRAPAVVDTVLHLLKKI